MMMNIICKYYSVVTKTHTAFVIVVIGKFDLNTFIGLINSKMGLFIGFNVAITNSVINIKKTVK